MLTDELIFFQQVYDDLCSCVYYDGGQIPVTEIARYCGQHGFDDETTDAVMIITRRVDLEVLAYRLKKQAKDKPKGKRIKPRK